MTTKSLSPSAHLQRENVRLQAENTELRDEVIRLRGFVSILNDLVEKTHTVTSDDQILPLLRVIFHKTLGLLGAPDGSVVLLDEEKNELVFVVVYGELAPDLTGYRIPADEGIAGWVLQNGQIALVSDVRTDRRFFADVDEKFKFRTQSVAAVPLVGGGKVIGVVEVLNQTGDEPFSEDEIKLLKLLCYFIGDVFTDIERHLPEPKK